jgi:chlorite dismutase
MADAKQRNVFTAYWLYKVDPAFSRLPAAEQAAGKSAFLAALEARPQDLTLRGVYSLVGLREDVDLMLWVYGPELDALQRLAVGLRHTGLGRYLTSVQTYVGAVTPARYDPGHQPAFMQAASPKNYISVYPFAKTSEWYLLPYERRRELMAEHGQVGRKYAVARDRVAPQSEKTARGRPATAVATAVDTAAEQGGGVLANTVDAFGLGDFEFILANESDDPVELVRMMESLRATEVRRYTKLDTPIFLGRLREPADALADL